MHIIFGVLLKKVKTYAVQTSIFQETKTKFKVEIASKFELASSTLNLVQYIGPKDLGKIF